MCWWARIRVGVAVDGDHDAAVHEPGGIAAKRGELIQKRLDSEDHVKQLEMTVNVAPIRMWPASQSATKWHELTMECDMGW